MFKKQVLLLVFGFLLLEIFVSAENPKITENSDNVKIKKHLRGVVYPYMPYVGKTDQGKYQGFLVDFMDFMAKESNLNYELYDTPDGTFGIRNRVNGTFSGMYGELQQKKAHFALSNTIVNEYRQEYFDTTEPFMEFSLAALVARNQSKELDSLKKLAEHADFPITVLKGGTTRRIIMDATDPVGEKLKAKFQAAKDGQLVWLAEGLTKVENGEKIAVVDDEPYLSYLAAQNCQLKLLPDKEKLYLRSYALVLPKKSPHLTLFNEALKNFKQSGQYQKAFDKYWKNSKCPQ